jgi:hypothetical protein
MNFSSQVGGGCAGSAFLAGGVEDFRVISQLGKSGKVFGIKMAQNPLFLEGNHNFACW